MKDSLAEIIKVNPITLVVGNPLERQHLRFILQDLGYQIEPIDPQAALPPGKIMIENYLSYLATREPAAILSAYSGLQDRYFANRSDRTRLVLLETGENFAVPPNLERFIRVYKTPLPDQHQIEKVYLSHELEISDQTVGFGRGLTKPELEIAIEEAKLSGRDIWQYIDDFRAHKLSLMGLKYSPPPPMRKVGGLDLILEIIPQIKYCMSPAGRARGVPLPKGLLLAGLPGTGKTFIAQVFSAELGYPMITLAVDAICDGGAPSLIKALEAVESMAPCMLFADEFDKLFATGTDRQVFGTFLSWLQDHKTFVYTFGTMNRPSHVPQEATRTGRFDYFFGLGFPLPNSRLHLFEIYLSIFDPRYTDLLKTCTETELRLLAESTNYFLASDISQLVYKVAIRLGMQGITEIPVEELIREASNFPTLYRRNPDSIIEMLNEIRGKCAPAESDSDRYITKRKINAY